jgi:hypothetical protein
MHRSICGATRQPPLAGGRFLSILTVHVEGLLACVRCGADGQRWNRPCVHSRAEVGAVRTMLFADWLLHPVMVTGRPTWRRRVIDALWRIRQAICGLHGHQLLMHFDPHRIYLECAACGRQTPGWNIAVGRHRASRVR